jgi:hypothetical protein
MQSEDQYLERTPDLVARVRAMREAAKKEMNRFTRVSDYDARRVVGHGPKPAVSAEAVVAPVAHEHPRKSGAKAASAQAALDFSSVPAEHDGDGEPE